MNLCSNNHDEICFEGRKCPLCAMRDEKDQEILELNAKMQQQDMEIHQLMASQGSQ